MTYPLLDKCILAAARWHAGGERDGHHPLPYITHPVEVVTCLRVIGGVLDEQLLCAAALHDVLEETSAKPKDLEELAGKRVLDLVQELTRQEPDDEETTGLTKREIWLLRAERLLEEISQMSPSAQQVKLADRLSNVREAIRIKPPEKLERYLWQTFQILKIVPREVNPGLWDAIRAEIGDKEPLKPAFRRNETDA